VGAFGTSTVADNTANHALNAPFWLPKLEGNKERNKMNQKKVALMGWKFLVIWECELQNAVKLKKHITEFLEKEE